MAQTPMTYGIALGSNLGDRRGNAVLAVPEGRQEGVLHGILGGVIPEARRVRDGVRLPDVAEDQGLERLRVAVQGPPDEGSSGRCPRLSPADWSRGADLEEK